jgi:hypothetical protein
VALRKISKTESLWKQTADAGSVEAQTALGVFYGTGQWGTQPPDDANAFVYFRKAAAQNSADAAFIVARSFEFGRGVSVDSTQALAFYQKASDGGNIPATTRLGLAYCRGELGVVIDKKKGVELLQKGASANSRDAIEWLRVYQPNIKQPLDPLTRGDIVEMVRNQLNPGRIVLLIHRYGIDYLPTKADTDQMVALGADSSVVTAVLEEKPKFKGPSR